MAQDAIVNVALTRAEIEQQQEMIKGILEHQLQLERHRTGFRIKRTDDLAWLREALPGAVVYWSSSHPNTLKIHYKDKWATVNDTIGFHGEPEDPEDVVALREQVKAAAEKHGMLLQERP